MMPFQSAPQMPPTGGTASPLAEALAKEGLMAPIQTASPGPAAMRSAPPLGAGFMPAPAPMGGMPGAMPGMPTPGQQQPQPPAGGMPFQQMGGPSMGAGMPGSTGQAGAMGPKPGMPFAGAPGGPAAAPGGPAPTGMQPQQRPPFG
ncbi:hypothetical protein [Aureimonas sp. SK2]|uniref:hypothetical protein n=1 Tax=Aureimonas sp. SK2 TaxID=3015992 RepID=UPI002444DEF1|nr:hypothetical protein [Aureimonas sp. SK2]